MACISLQSLTVFLSIAFSSGSVACKGDFVYGFPAPGSREVLSQFLQARTSDDMLGSSSFKVDFQSVTIGGKHNFFKFFFGFLGGGGGCCVPVLPFLKLIHRFGNMFGYSTQLNKIVISQRKRVKG